MFVLITITTFPQVVSLRIVKVANVCTFLPMFLVKVYMTGCSLFGQ